MKNLKKVLSLALAFAMVLGLCVTGMGAEDVTTAADWDSVTDKNAALLLNAFEIMEGSDEDGVLMFNPEGNVTRAQAAAMISRALWGGVDTPELYANGNVGGYIDVATGAWYMGYINYMTVIGVMTGKGDGEFDPDGNVTGYELLKMCLVALGYDAETEGLTGLGWDLRTMALATLRTANVNLTEGATVTDWNAPLSRMNAATIVANMIWRDTVVYDDGVIKTNGTFATQVLGLEPITGTLVANEYTSIIAINQANAINPNGRGYADENAIISFRNNTYKVELDSTIYDVGKPVSVYLVDDKVYSVTLVEGTEVEPSFYNSALTNGDVVNSVSNVTYLLNDVPAVNDMADYGTFSGNNSVNFTAFDNVEVKWFDTNGDGYIDLVKGYRFGVANMPKVVSNDNGTYYDVDNSGAVNQGDIATTSVSFGEAAEAHVAIINAPTNVFGGTYYYGYIMDTAEGEITRISTDKKTVYVDGLEYTNTDLADVNIAYGEEGTFYLWANGSIESFAPTTPTSVDPVYAVLYDAGYEAWGSTTAMSGSTGVVIEVKAILPDGTNGTFEVANVISGGKTYSIAKQDETKITNAASMTATDNTTTGAPQLFSVSGTAISGGALGSLAVTGQPSMLVEYTLNEDGTININLDNVISNTFTGTITKGTALIDSKYVTSKTVTFIEDANGDWTVVTGLTIPSSNGTATGTYVPVKYLETANAGYGYIMLQGYTAAASSTTAIFYALSDAEQIGVENNLPVYEAVIFNSETNKVETVETSTPVAKGNVYDTETNGAYTNVAQIAGVGGDYIAAIGEGVLNINGTIVETHSETLYIHIDGENSAVITAADLTVQSAATAPAYKVIVADTNNQVAGVEVVIVIK